MPTYKIIFGNFLEKDMNSVKKIAMAMCIALPVFAHAGESVVKWHDFNDYRDVRASNQAKRLISQKYCCKFRKTYG